jgi:outer membrane protein, heavy metal efflux system
MSIKFGRQFIRTFMVGTLMSVASAAQTPSVTLADVYREVARANPRTIAARALSRAADARISAASRPPDPQIQLAWMNYTLPGLAPMATTGMTQLQVMQMLPLGGKLSLAGRIASSQADAARQRAADVLWEARSQAAMAFYDRYTIERSLKIDRETIRLLQDIEKVAAAMYEVGEGRQADVLRAQVEVAKMAQDTIRMQAMGTSIVARLDALLGSGTVLRGSPTLPTFPDSLPSPDALEALIGARPMIKAGLAEVTAAASAEALTRREIWADLQVGIQLGQRGGEMGVERMGSLMLGASLPVFARSRQLQMRNEAAAMRQMAEADLVGMRADTRARLIETHASLVRARQLAELYRSTILPQAEAMATSSLAAYRAGSVDFMTLVDARMAVNKYRKDLVALAAEEGKAWAELEMLAGHELVDLGRTTEKGDIQ